MENAVKNIPVGTLDYTRHNDTFTLFLRVSQKDYTHIQRDCSVEMFIHIMDDDFLCFNIEMLGAKYQSHCTMEIPSYYKNDDEVCYDLQSLYDKSSITLCVYALKKPPILLGVKIYEQDKIFIRKWLGENVDIIIPTLKKQFEDIPTLALIPQRTAVKFWFICKTSNSVYAQTKNKINGAIFEAVVYDDKLVLHLNCGEVLVGFLPIEKKYINYTIKDDFKLFMKYSTITIVINNEKAMDETAIVLTIPISEDTKEVISDFMGI